MRVDFEGDNHLSEEEVATQHVTCQHVESMDDNYQYKVYTGNSNFFGWHCY